MASMADERTPANVLIVDSDRQLRNLLRMLLQRRAVVEELPSAAQALEFLRASAEPLVVLWNLWLSHVDGLPVLDVVEHEPALRRHAFLLLTADAAGLPVALRHQVKRLRLPLLELPFDSDELLEQLDTARQTLAASTQRHAARAADE